MKHFEAKMKHFEAKMKHFEAKMKHFEAKMKHFEAKTKYLEAKMKHFEAKMKHSEAKMKHFEAGGGGRATIMISNIRIEQRLWRKTKRRPEARRPIHWQKRRPETHLVAAENEFQDTKKAAVDEISGSTRSRKRLERQK